MHGFTRRIVRPSHNFGAPVILGVVHLQRTVFEDIDEPAFPMRLSLPDARFVGDPDLLFVEKERTLGVFFDAQRFFIKVMADAGEKGFAFAVPAAHEGFNHKK